MDRVDYETLIVQDVISLYNNNNLNISPWYQRRSVWSLPQKSYLINTLFEQKPIPTIYIRHSLDIEANKSIREVVDGQQRIRAIIDYIEDVFTAKHPSYSKKVKFSELKRTDAERFKLTSLSIGSLLGATDEDVIEIFGRLNSVAKTLNVQEKRNAVFSGEFKQFCLQQAAKRLTFWRTLNIFTANNIARMAEVQFVSDLTLNYINGLSDYSAAKLDQMYKDNDDSFSKQDNMEKKFHKVFSQIAKLKPEAIRDTIFNRPPLFFSLCVVLGSTKKKLSSQKIESALYKIDESINSDIKLADRKKADIEFYTACNATTQRIHQRTIRDSFIRMHLGI